MKLFAFEPKLAHAISDWDTHGVAASHLAETTNFGRVSMLHYEPGATLGVHPTRLPQLFLVISGAGWVSGEDGERHDISAGTAALWEPDEVHASGSSQGMTVVVVQSPDIDPKSLDAAELG